MAMVCDQEIPPQVAQKRHYILVHLARSVYREPCGRLHRLYAPVCGDAHMVDHADDMHIDTDMRLVGAQELWQRSPTAIF